MVVFYPTRYTNSFYKLPVYFALRIAAASFAEDTAESGVAGRRHALNQELHLLLVTEHQAFVNIWYFINHHLPTWLSLSLFRLFLL